MPWSVRLSKGMLVMLFVTGAIVCCVSMGLLFSFLDINLKTGTHSGLRVIVGLAACLASFEMSVTLD